LLVLQGQQVDPRNHNVSSQQLWWNLLLSQYPSYDIQVFLLNQGNLAFASRGFLKVITFQPCIWVGCDFADGMHFQQALGANADPFNLALLGDAAEVLPLKGFVVAHGSTSSITAMASCR
jgi:hypothetical protein